MPRFACRLAIVSLAAAVFATAPARAVSLPVVGSLRIELDGFGAQMSSTTLQSTGSLVVNGAGAGPHVDTLAIPANFFQASKVVQPLSMSDENPINGVQLTVGNSAGTIANGDGPVALNGFTKACLFGSCDAAVANIDVPMQVVGAGGTQFVTASVNLTVVGAPWTTGTAAVGTITQMGFARGPNGLASSTGLPSGELLLVTPIFVSTNILPLPTMPSFGFLTLHFVPEPTTLLLVGGGIALLGAMGQRRLSRR